MTTPTKSTLRQIPAGIWALGLVSMLMDISSEMIHSLLPLFMVTALGASAFAVGLVEGLAESTALIVKIFSGAFSDYFGKRKGLAVFGYAMGALSKPFFAVASTTGIVLTARLLDRTGKGIADDFLWSETSPFKMIGGWDGAADAELGYLVRACIKSYPGEVVWTSLRSTLQQMAKVATGDGLDEFQPGTYGIFIDLLPRTAQSFQALHASSSIRSPSRCSMP